MAESNSGPDWFVRVLLMAAGGFVGGISLLVLVIRLGRPYFHPIPGKTHSRINSTEELLLGISLGVGAAIGCILVAIATRTFRRVKNP